MNELMTKVIVEELILQNFSNFCDSPGLALNVYRT